ncbi:MAG: hypothetical protein JJU20_01535 [Opitutales bacterium]|nr:hypothetical protein [Opitutales bacterium]
MISARATVFSLIILAAFMLSKPLLVADWERTISSDIVAHVAAETPSGYFLFTWDDVIMRAPALDETLVSVHDSSERLNAIGHDSGSTVVAVGNNGHIVYSTNGGDSWQTASLAAPLLGDLHGVAYGGGNWVAVGSGADGMAVLRSTDGGSNWTQENSPGEGELKGVAWNGSSFYAGGGYLFDGILLTSSNGSSWTPASVDGDFGLLNFVVSDSAGAILAGGEEASLVRSEAAGANLAAMQADVSGDLTTAVTVANGHWLVGGPELIVLEVMAGQTPVLIHGPADGAESVDALVISGPNSYIIFGNFIDLFRPLNLVVDWGGSSGTVSIRVSNLIWGDGYILQRSGNLSDWSDYQSFTASGLTQTWNLSVPEGQQSYFYRVVPE